MIPLAHFQWPLEFCTFTTIAVYIASVITANVSQVDRVWTFMPTIYTAYFALLPLWPTKPAFILLPYTPECLVPFAQQYSPRALLIFGLVFTWMCRLSYNTYRRGLFSLSDEDYRWAVLRTKISPFLFQVVNLSFIAIIQNLLLLGLAVPAYYAAKQHDSLVSSDLAIAATSLILLVLEFTSDNQQYAFQTYKYATIAKDKKPYDEKEQWPGARLNWTVEDAKRGFITKGLWAYSRHPNFACEQAFWWMMNLIPIVSPGEPNIRQDGFKALVSQIILSIKQLGFLESLQTFTSNSNLAYLQVQLTNLLIAWSPLLPAFCLTLLFISSTAFTEGITKSKYTTAYTAYQERVGMFSPVDTFRKALALRLRGSQRKQSTEGLVWGKEKRL